MPLLHRFASAFFLGLALLIGGWGAFGAEDPGEALREAARAGDLARIEALLAAGAQVDAPARYGQTPLYYRGRERPSRGGEAARRSAARTSMSRTSSSAPRHWR